MISIQKQTVEKVVRRLREYAGAQITGRELSSAELRLPEQLIQRLIDRQMRPIVAIARAQIEPDSDVRMPAAIRMPRAGARATRILQASDGMIEAARPFEAAFVANGLPADFLARFTKARNELEGVLGGCATHIGTHVAARKGLEVEIRREARPEGARQSGRTRGGRDGAGRVSPSRPITRRTGT